MENRLAAAQFEIGGLYNRTRDIHDVFGGQSRGGISTPAGSEFIFLFTGEAGRAHGYDDFSDDEGFHLYGEGQSGDMTMTRGNLAISKHAEEGRRLLLFQALGKGRPYRYLGEYSLARIDSVEAASTSAGKLRKAFVFVLKRVPSDESIAQDQAIGSRVSQFLSFDATVRSATLEVRTKQRLFRDNLIGVEKGCRVTGVEDLRFLTASHIKPWSACETGLERVDGNNGLLLAPHIDHLFDNGWISFENSGKVIVSPELPITVVEALLKGHAPMRPRAFNLQQRAYLRYHRQFVLRGFQITGASAATQREA